MDRLYLSGFPGTKLRVSLIKEGSHNSKTLQALSSSKDLYQYIRSGLEKKDREMFVVVLVNTRNIPIGVNLVSVGTLTAGYAQPREVFKTAILGSAAAVILVHNHPSGDPVPSPEDQETTRKLVEAGKLLGILVHDHVIIGDNNYYSFRDNAPEYWA